MVRLSALTLGLYVLATTTTANPLERAKLVKRTLADDICGTPDGAHPAADNDNAATWNKYNMGDWFKNMYGVNSRRNCLFRSVLIRSQDQAMGRHELEPKRYTSDRHSVCGPLRGQQGRLVEVQ